jgi:hypothetical protein
MSSVIIEKEKIQFDHQETNNEYTCDLTCGTDGLQVQKLDIAGDAKVGGNITVTGNSTVTGNIKFGNKVESDSSGVVELIAPNASYVRVGIPGKSDIEFEPVYKIITFDATSSVFRTSDADTPANETQVIINSKAIGIGLLVNVTPSEALDVAGNIKASGGVYASSLISRGDGAAGLGIFSTSATAVDLEFVNSSGLGEAASGNPVMRWSNNEIEVFGGAPDNTITFRVSGTVTANGTVLTSDDRLKHNEEEVVDALSTINKLKLLKYDKTSEMLDADFNGDLGTIKHNKEIGLIAQDLQNIPELSFLVGGGEQRENVIEEGVAEDGTIIPKTVETVELPYTVNYQGITNVGLKAIQELSVENETLKNQVANLLVRVLALENK